MTNLYQRYFRSWEPVPTFLVVVSAALGTGFILAQEGVSLATMLILIPPGIGYSLLVLRHPMIGLKTFLHMCFFLLGLGRFVTIPFPVGLLNDGLLLLTLIGVAFSAKRNEWSRLHNVVFYPSLIWWLYTLFQLVNPESKTVLSWFYGVRGMSFYWIQALVIGLMLVRRREDLNYFINTWMGWSAAAALWAFKQQYIGLTEGEDRWMMEGAYLTHLLQGKLRSFSFYTDAGQFGAAMAQVTLFALIRAMDEKDLKKKALFAGLTALYFWGFALSGSRGPLFIIAAGLPIYILLRKNFRIMVLGAALAIGGYVFLRYTFIGQSNYQIQRMRSALNPDDPSFQVRLYNQRQFAAYLQSRPLGAGIGSAGATGGRFSSGSILTTLGIDSWYVKIWVETGIVGLVIHLLVLLIILGYGVYKVYHLKDPTLHSIMSGLVSGYTGILLANYGNQLFGQMPTSGIAHMTMVFLVLCDQLEREKPKSNTKAPSKTQLFPARSNQYTPVNP